MKKSKVIIPAMALILFSTAASISGTVAWFTANRAVSFTTDQFALMNVDGNLDLTLTGGVGTSINETVVSPVANHEISDASFNPATHELWNDDGTGSKFIKLGDNSTYTSSATNTGANYLETEQPHVWYNKSYLVSSTPHYVYHAFTWKATVSYTWGADFTGLNIFFDYAGSTMTANDSGANQTTSKAFRIAFVTTSHTVVWTKLQAAAGLSGIAGTNSDDAAEVAYGATGLTSTSFSYFASDKFAHGNVVAASATAVGSYAKVTDGSANQATMAAREDYLGTITHANTTDSIDIYCIAWYEGCDDAIIDANKADLEKVQSTIKFYSALPSA